ncbi:M56 family metallopeptidase [Kocuria marina]|uniref:M56 family metallopeptidase n=1 Tax=Kocuria marina TaxID=223184 RepID=UPI0011A8DD0C|nr:M56 family metallopeptidase [Kocuria indica]
MISASIGLAAFALALAWPVPILFSHAKWPTRAPATALVLWQAVALAGGLSMLGALLTFGLAPFGPDLVTGGISFAASFLGDQPWVPAGLMHILALSGAVLLGGHLLLNLMVTIVRAERDRRRHAQLVLLLSTPLPDAPGTRLLDNPAPVAYCLPGAFTTMTVLSAGLLSLLDENELDAVIEHEKAHATQRHDIVLMLFRAWKASLPWFPIADRAHREVGLLVEMLADDRARRSVDDRTLARAVALVSTGGSAAPSHRFQGTWTGAVPAEDARHRILRLEATPVPAGQKATVIGAAAALIIVPTILLLAPGLTNLLD